MTVTRNNSYAKSTVCILACLLLCDCWGKLPPTFAKERADANLFDDSVIRKAFAASADGFSVDEVLINDQLRVAFLEQLFPDDPPTSKQESDVLQRLLQIRKAGKLNISATKRGRKPEEWISPIAEIAARVVTDRHRVATDTLLTDRQLRKELQDEANKIAPKIDAYIVRKSILQLRKKRALKPELVLRVADWSREIKTYTLDQIRSESIAGNLPAVPGVYLFRDDKGYLYIGEASNLATRLKQHLTDSDRQSLADFLAGNAADKVTVELHQFPKNSPAAKLTVRRAYESELIRSRNPRFNARP
ncbi:MAG: GIY-YIG nuclease family protein [Pirellulaceae bacterium]